IVSFSGSLLAVPSLQLDTQPGLYDPVTQTTIATSNPFTLRALIDASSIDITRTFYISAAIVPSTTSPGFGSFAITVNPLNSSSGMQYGNPPVDALINDLPGHGIFNTWYAEVSFSAVGSSTIPAYNVVDNTSAPGNLNYVDFTVNIAGLTGQPNSPYAVHFDL